MKLTLKWAVILLALFAFVLQTMASDSDSKNDWPKWRGANQDGKSQASDVFKEGYGLKILWKKPLGSGYSSISVADDQAVTMFSDSTFDYIVALDTDSGDELWRYKIDSTYVGHDGSHNGPISTPVIDGDRVFALGPKGHLIAVDAQTGKKVWSTHIVEDHGAIPPLYGFATAPHVNGNVLILETGGPNKTISGFDKKTGDLLWAAGPDTVNYQSPITVDLAGEKQLLCIGDKYLIGLHPESGKQLWQFHHKGGVQTIQPVVVGGDKVFLHHKGNESVLIQIKKQQAQYSVEELWTTKAFKFTYAPAIYHDGYLYGYSGRFLSCVDAETGKSVWKSRPPGDGFLIVVDGHLVIQTKKGALHVARASSEGYQEVASLQVFEGLTWTPPSFANGRIYVRNLYEIASLAVVPVDRPLTVVAKPKPKAVAPNSRFAKWVKKVEAAADKKALVDAFMESQKQFPIIEGDNLVHFVYRGEAKDMVISGDMLDFQNEEVMNRIEGTDFFYASFKLEPDARVNYRFTKDLEQNITDPLNQRSGPTMFFGPMSEVAMPSWTKPTHLDEPTNGAQRGRIDTLDFKSEILGSTRRLDIYLPAGYDNGDQRYPVIYVNDGKLAQNFGQTVNSLDNLLGKTAAPVIAVFVSISPQDARQDFTGPRKDSYARMMAEELVPFIDKTYRTQANSKSRALVGQAFSGYAALYTAFKYPNVFSKVSSQTTYLITPTDQQLMEVVEAASTYPEVIYLDWGKYDLRNVDEGWSVVEDNRKFADFLKEKNIAVVGGEVNEGFGWRSWRNRTDKILETFYPL